MPCILWFLNSLKTSKRDAAVLPVQHDFVVAKKPLPLEPHINKGINDALHEILSSESYVPL